MIERYRWLSVALLLTGCASTDEAPPPQLDRDLLAAIDTPLGAAVRVALQSPTLANRVELMQATADVYIAKRLPLQAAPLLQYAVATVDDIRYTPVERMQVLAGLAASLIGAGEVDGAILLVERLYLLTQQSEPAEERIAMLQILVDLCFFIGEGAFDILNDAIGLVFIVDDPLQRTRLLTHTAGHYLRDASEDAVATLLQHAIPSALSIANREEQSVALLWIGRQFTDLGEADTAEFYIERAIGLLDYGFGLQHSLPEGDTMRLQSVELLAGFMRIEEAIAVTEQITDPQLKVQGFLDIAGLLLRSGIGDSTSVRQLTKRAFDIMVTYPNAAVAVVGRQFSDLVLLLSSLGAFDMMVQIAGRLERLLSMVVDPQVRSPFVTLLAEIYVLTEEQNRLTALLEEPLTSETVAAAIRVAELLTDTDRQSAANLVIRLVQNEILGGRGAPEQLPDLAALLASRARYDELLEIAGAFPNARAIVLTLIELDRWARPTNVLSVSQRLQIAALGSISLRDR